MLAGDWRVDEVVKVVDGDSIHVQMSTRPQLVTHNLAQVWMTAKPWKLRLVHIDTPERGEDGWAEARSFVTQWLGARDGAVRCETLYPDNFGRMLADVYEAGDRSKTLTYALLTAGYEPYRP